MPSDLNGCLWSKAPEDSAASMKFSYGWRRHCRLFFSMLLVVAIVTCAIRFWRHSAPSDVVGDARLNAAASPVWTYSRWPEFALPAPEKTTHALPITECFGAEFANPSVEHLLKMREKWKLSRDPQCRKVFRMFESLFSIRQTKGKLVLPSKLFEAKVKEWLGNNDQYFAEVLHQEITSVMNRYTYETTLFNPLRSKRPIAARGDISERDYVDDISNTTSKGCDFCNYRQFTAEDTFGRLESAYVFTAANAFKYDAWHSMVVPLSHHPLTWTKVEFMDMFHLASQWIQRVVQEDESVLYPLMLWDLLPHSGSSQVHPHAHISISPYAYGGVTEGWRAAADRYYKDVGDNFFTDLVAVHSTLGLAVQHGQAVAIASLTPKKENEMVIIGGEVNSDFLELLYSTIRAFIDDAKLYCFSLSMVYPPLKQSTPGRVPAFARIVTRGAAYDVRSDVSSMELFGPTNINQDPFKLIKSIRNSVATRAVLAS